MGIDKKQILQLAANGVSFYCEDTDSGEYEILNVTSIDLAHETIEIGATTFDFEDIGKYVKPVMHPLSDLAEEITHNGETFVPYDELDNYHNFSKVNYNDIEKDPTRYPYTIVCKLLEWHFDIFGLIENNLAININTLD
ncbi:hypothetical protein [Flavobacterium sp. HSC-61S13]|uniref:hypothetical protein n=1 Tax=Flavobacterium sp. HSC-61S13 TaxID=2910963 RepID=UPI0020A1C8B1|nr:hypothetical protein [Flavobacterium sp. HSC-61S13]MCP1996642.1 hypothetical protein [Flavobacterium sp. HSC-61S13]